MTLYMKCVLFLKIVKYKNYFSSIRKYRKVESYIHEYKHNLYWLEIINNSTIFDIVIYDLFNFL